MEAGMACRFSRGSGVGDAERHAAHELLLGRNGDGFADQAMERRERSLRAGVEVVRARGHHDVLEEHAEVEPAALAHDAVDGEHQADRRAEEFVVAAMLRVHARLVGLGDAEQAVEIPADLAPPLDEGRAPLGRVVGVFLAVTGPLDRIVVGRDEALRQVLQRRAGEHGHVPRLRVGSRGRT
jgi:hypothetical protein